MKQSENYGFYLPSRDTDDLADINQLSENFKKIDQELHKLGKNNGGADVDTSLFANAIQNTVSGGVVFAFDVSALERKLKVRLSGNVAENLLPITPVAKPMGIDYENGDGSYLLNGTINSEFPVLVFISSGSMSLERGKTYSIDLGTATNKVHLSLSLTDNNYTKYEELQTDSTGKLTFTVGENNVIQALTLTGEQGTVIDNLLVRPALYKNTNITDYTKVKLYRYGINSSVDKVEYTPNADGTVEVEILSPYMSLVTDKCGLTISTTYNFDTKTYVDKNKGSGGDTTKYEIVNSIEEMTDTSKAYVLSTDGNIYAYANVTVKHEAENKFIPSEAAINKSMGVSDLETKNGFVWSNPIEVDLAKESPFRVKVEGTKITEDTSASQKLWLCSDDSGNAKLSAAIIQLGETSSNFTTLLSDGTIYADYKGNKKIDSSIISQTQTIRIGFKLSDTAINSVDELNGVKITFSSENYEETVSAWVNTGIKPSANGGVNYVDLLVKLAEIQAMLSVASRGISDD